MSVWKEKCLAGSLRITCVLRPRHWEDSEVSNRRLLTTHRLMKEMSFYFPCISWTRCFVSSQGELGIWFRCQGPPEPRLAEPAALPEATGVWRKLFAPAGCPPQASHTVPAFWHLYRQKLSGAGQHREYLSCSQNTSSGLSVFQYQYFNFELQWGNIEYCLFLLH